MCEWLLPKCYALRQEDEEQASEVHWGEEQEYLTCEPLYYIEYIWIKHVQKFFSGQLLMARFSTFTRGQRVLNQSGQQSGPGWGVKGTALLGPGLCQENQPRKSALTETVTILLDKGMNDTSKSLLIFLHTCLEDTEATNFKNLAASLQRIFLQSSLNSVLSDLSEPAGNYSKRLDQSYLKLLHIVLAFHMALAWSGIFSEHRVAFWIKIAQSSYINISNISRGQSSRIYELSLHCLKRQKKFLCQRTKWCMSFKARKTLL